MRNVLLMSTAASLLAMPVWAQTDQATTSQADQQVAEQCLEDLQAFADRQAEEGYWFSGYRYGTGWRYGVGPRGGMAGTPPAAGTAAPAAVPGADPWGAAGWQVSPGHEIRSLENAAAVLARQGDEEGCQYLLTRLEETYTRYAGQLREAGVEPGEISAWRQQQIAAAVPVGEVEQVLSLDDILGTEVRNPADDELGTVEDVVMAPESGEIALVIVGHGGFLGMGEDYAAVPWPLLRTTPGFETFLLDATEETLQNAPEVDPDQLQERDGFAAASQELESYWREHQSNP